MDYTGKVAIVTGGSSGIGQAVAEILAQRGVKVLIGYIGDKDIAENVVKGIVDRGGTASLFYGDISKTENIVQMFDTCIERYGNPDILIANAARMGSTPLLEITEEDYYAMFDVNVKGTLFCLKEAGKKLKDNGRIIVTSSSSVRYPINSHILYISSKSALHSMVEVAARELAHRGITVNTVLPGLTATKKALADHPPEFIQSVVNATPFGRVGEPEDVAAAIVMLAGEDSGWISGQHITANGAAKY